MELLDKHTSNETTKSFQKLNTVLYLCDLTDFWIENVKLPAVFVKIYDFLTIFIEILMLSFMMLEVGAFFTEHDLSEKQVADRMIFGTSFFFHPILYIYCLNLKFYKKDVREVLRQLTADLKRAYNNREVEIQMLRKLKFYIIAYVSSCGLCMVFYGVSALVQNIRLGITYWEVDMHILNTTLLWPFSFGIGTPFTTVITAWPDVSDTSQLAHWSRVVFYFIWWIYFTRVSAAYILILSMFISLSFQYRNLSCYFIDLNRIFDQPSIRSDKETKFKSRFIIGVKLHSQTLWCQSECQKIYSVIFSTQLLMTVAELASVMSQMVNYARTVVNLAAVISTTCGSMISAGFLMWNAGDVTVEASYLPAAIYACGWNNCSSRVCARQLVSLAIMQPQKPVVFLALGVVEMSYETYLAIVKSSYSAFSLLY